MSERFEVYLCSVAEKIRWKRARPFALRELRIHLLEQKEAFQDSGMAVGAAEEAVVGVVVGAVVGAVVGVVERVSGSLKPWIFPMAAVSVMSPPMTLFL